MKILAVDDDLIASLVMVAMLKSLGHEVVQATNADQAYVFVQEKMIRLIISDWQMEGGGGLDLCRRLRALRGDDLYFILVTQQQANDESERKAMEAGVDDFLSKPVNRREMRLRLHVAERVLRITQKLKQWETPRPDLQLP